MLGAITYVTYAKMYFQNQGAEVNEHFSDKVKILSNKKSFQRHSYSIQTQKRKNISRAIYRNSCVLPVMATERIVH